MRDKNGLEIFNQEDMNYIKRILEHLNPLSEEENAVSRYSNDINQSLEAVEIKKICMESKRPLIDLIKNKSGKHAYRYFLDHDFKFLLNIIPHLVQYETKVRRSLSAVDNASNNVVHLLLEKLKYHPSRVRRNWKDTVVEETFDADEEITVGIQNCIRVFVQYDPGLLQGQNIVGWTPFHMAARFGNLLLAYDAPHLKTIHQDFFTFLIEKGANIQAEDVDGSTPIHIAAGCGQFMATQRLIALGAKFQQPNRHGSTPIHLVSLGHNKENASPSNYLLTRDSLFAAVRSKEKLDEFSHRELLNAIDVIDKDGYFPSPNILTLSSKAENKLFVLESTVDQEQKLLALQRIADDQRRVFDSQSISDRVFFSGMYDLGIDGSEMDTVSWIISPLVCAEVFYHQLVENSNFSGDEQKAFLYLICVHPLRDLLETLPKFMQQEKIVSIIKNTRIHLEKGQDVSRLFEEKKYSILHVLLEKLKIDLSKLIERIHCHHDRVAAYTSILSHLLTLVSTTIELIVTLNTSLLTIQDAKGQTPLHQVANLIQQLDPHIRSIHFNPFEVFIQHGKTIDFKDHDDRSLSDLYRATQNSFQTKLVTSSNQMRSMFRR